MVPSERLEDTLPLSAPKPAHPILGPSSKIHYSVYTTIQLSEPKREKLLSDINSDRYGSQTCRLAPDQGPEPSRTLREACDHHLRQRDVDNTIHPYIFFVADTEPCETILVVNLRAETTRKDVKSVVGVSRWPVEEADCLACNDDIGNIGWVENKINEGHKWGDWTSVYTNTRYFPSDPREKPAERTDSDETCYAWYSLVRGGLQFCSRLEPDWKDKNWSETRFWLEGGTCLYDDPFEQGIKARFPFLCWSSPRIDRKILLVLTSAEGSMSVYRALWNAESELAKYPWLQGVDMRDQPHREAVMKMKTELEFVRETTLEEAWEAIQSLGDV